MLSSIPSVAGAGEAIIGCSAWAGLQRGPSPIAGDYPEQYRAVSRQRSALASSAQTGHDALVQVAGFGWSWIVFGVAAAVVGSGCGASDDGVSSASAGDSSPASPSTQPVAAGSISPGTTETPTGQKAPTVATTSAPTTSAATSTVNPENTVPSRFTFSGEGIVGVGRSASLFEAAEVLGVEPQRTSDPAMGGGVSACTGTPAFWTLHDGGLTLVFEGNSESEAVLTNWAYVGGSVAQYEELVAAPDIAIGDRRDELDGAFSSVGDYGDSIDVVEPYFLRFGVDSGVITWFGIVDCAFEGEPAAP